MAVWEVIISFMVAGQKMKFFMEDFFSKCDQNPSNCCASFHRAETCTQKRKVFSYKKSIEFFLKKPGKCIADEINEISSLTITF